MPVITPSVRIKRTPFSDGVEKAGVTSYTVYNHTLLVTKFKSYLEDYHHLKRHVQIWDVSCQKQIRIRGKDSEKLMRLLSPRDLTQMQLNQCYYVPLIDKNGGLLNDPVVLKLTNSEYWISIGDSDYLLYALGVSDSLSLDVLIDEAAIYPLAIQGPKAEKLMVKIFGADVQTIKFFRYKKIEFQGYPLVVARSGWSKQGGFEIYVSEAQIAMALWDSLLKAGEEFNVRVGCPNLIERIEGGLLSYGNDISQANTPFEAGLGKYITSKDDFIGKENLMKRPFKKVIKPIEIYGKIPACDRTWSVLTKGKIAGQITSAAYSPDFACNVAIGMINKKSIEETTQVEIQTHDGSFKGLVRSSFWS